MSKEKIRIAIMGCGRFCEYFVPLFKHHPSVEKVYVCDLKKERAEEYSQKFDVEIIESFEKALSSDKINSVAIFTQRNLHGKSLQLPLPVPMRITSRMLSTSIYPKNSM